MDNFLLAQYPLLSVLAHTLVHALWQITLLALLAAFSFVQLRRQSAAMRHAVGLFFLLAAPLLTLLTFAWLWSASVPGAVSIRAAALPTPPLTLPAEVLLQRFDWLSLGLSLLWLLGAVIMLLRQFGGWWLIAELDRQAHRDLPSAWQDKVLSMQQAMAISRTVTVRVAAHVNSPFTARLLRPVIWFPATVLTRLPAEQVEMLLAHELAHVCRLDWLWNGLQCVVESLFFFHPGVWWLSRRIREEREHACDDLAVAVCGNAIALAEALAALEQQRHDFPRLALAAHGGSLMQRITRLLSNSSQRPRWRTPAALLGLLCTTMLFASQMELLSQNLVGLRIEESTDGMLMPGDYREITANDAKLQRYYHVSVDAQWQQTEIYKEAGMVKPIDESVRAWLAKVDALRVMPSPPDIPALPPAPMSPPELTESELFQDLLKVVLADSRVGQVVGTPVQVRSEDVHGHLRAWGDNNSRGESTLAFVITGPKGRVQVKLSGLRDESVWHLAALEVVPTP